MEKVADKPKTQTKTSSAPATQVKGAQNNQTGLLLLLAVGGIAALAIAPNKTEETKPEESLTDKDILDAQPMTNTVESVSPWKVREISLKDLPFETGKVAELEIRSHAEVALAREEAHRALVTKIEDFQTLDKKYTGVRITYKFGNIFELIKTGDDTYTVHCHPNIPKDKVMDKIKEISVLPRRAKENNVILEAWHLEEKAKLLMREADKRYAEAQKDQVKIIEVGKIINLNNPGEWTNVKLQVGNTSHFFSVHRDDYDKYSIGACSKQDREGLRKFLLAILSSKPDFVNNIDTVLDKLLEVADKDFEDEFNSKYEIVYREVQKDKPNEANITLKWKDGSGKRVNFRAHKALDSYGNFIYNGLGMNYSRDNAIKRIAECTWCNQPEEKFRKYWAEKIMERADEIYMV